MPYDPSKPANGAPILSAELREQFAGLKALIDDLQAALSERPTQTEVMQMILAQSAGAVTHVEPLNQPVSNPPTQAEVENISNTLDALITELRR
jgi:hypothetical protein